MATDKMTLLKTVRRDKITIDEVTLTNAKIEIWGKIEAETIGGFIVGKPRKEMCYIITGEK